MTTPLEIEHVLKNIVEQQKIEAERDMDIKLQKIGYEKQMEQVFKPLTNALNKNFESMMEQFISDTFKNKNNIAKKTLRGILVNKLGDIKGNQKKLYEAFIKHMEHINKEMITKEEFTNLWLEFSSRVKSDVDSEYGPRDLNSLVTGSIDLGLKIGPQEIVINQQITPTLLTFSQKDKNSGIYFGDTMEPFEITQIDTNTIEISNERTSQLKARINNVKVMDLLTQPASKPIDSYPRAISDSDIAELVDIINSIKPGEIEKIIRKSRSGGNQKIKLIKEFYKSQQPRHSIDSIVD